MKTRRLCIVIRVLLICAAGWLAASLAPRGATWAEAPAPSVTPAPPPAIHLAATTFVPSVNEPDGVKPSEPGEVAPPAGDMETPHGEAQPSTQYLVQFEGPILDAWRAGLEGVGATILDYIPDYAYKVAMGKATPQALRQLPGVVWVGPFRSEYRASPQLATAGRQIVRVEMESTQVDKLLAALPDWGATLIGQDGRTVTVEMDSARLLDLGRLEGVRWISPLEIPHSSLDVVAQEIQVNDAWNRNYQGNGQMVNVTDSGLDTGADYPQINGDMHLDLDNRVSHLRSWPISGQYNGLLNNPGANDGAADLDSGHGTHVAGCAVGNGARSSAGGGPLYRGVAPQSLLTFQAVEQYCDFNALGIAQGFSDGYWLLGIPADLSSLYNEAYNWGSRVQNNSWNLGSAGAYTIGAQQTDRFVWEHRDMVIVSAAGNEGQDSNRDGLIDPMSILAPATAKNVIAVGATENRRPSLSPPAPYQNYGQFSGLQNDPFRNDPLGNAGIDGLAAFSGRGPTKDGRLAPHVVAPGTWIISTRSSRANGRGWPSDTTIDQNPYYVYMGGTSSSTPLVSGAVGLVRQAYQSRGHTPSAALVKATIIQTAKDIAGQYGGPFGEAGPIPNNGEGWGALNIERAVAPTGRFVDQTTALRTSEAASYTYAARASAGMVKVTLVWTDYPAAVEAGVQLVNDLDLEVTAPNGTLYRGNVFAGGFSTTGGSADRRNNVECVYLPSAQAGDYRVTVRGHNVPQGPQNFALLVTMPFAPYSQRIQLPLIGHQATISSSPTPTLAPGEFRDDFSNPTSNWLVTTTTSYSMSYVDGAYRIQVSPSQRRIGSLVGIDRPGDRLLEVDARAMNDVSQAYGLIMSSDTATATSCAFIVSPTGHYALVCWQGSNETTLVNWTPSDAIVTDSGWNRLSVRRVGQQIECRINGTLALAQADANLGHQRFGLVSFSFGSAQSDSRFDNFHVLPLGGSRMGEAQPLVDGDEDAVEGGLQAPLRN